jgi:hypothetical protein
MYQKHQLFRSRFRLFSQQYPMESDQTIFGLLRRRSEIAGAIEHLDGKVAGLRADLLHIDAALRIMGYDGPECALPIRKACANGIFHRKELPRLSMALLRANGDGLQASEIAFKIATDKGWDTSEKRFQVSLTDKVSRAMSKLKTKGLANLEICETGYVWRMA